MVASILFRLETMSSTWAHNGKQIIFSCSFSLSESYLHRFALLRCHGEKGNVVYEMAKDKNLLAGNKDSKGLAEPNYVRSNGEVIPSEISDKLSGLFGKIYGGDEFDEEQNNYHGSTGNFFAEK